MSGKNTPTFVHLGAVSVLVPNPIWKLLQVDNLWLVLFDFSGLPTATARRNLWCFDNKGQLVWKVQGTPYLYNTADVWNGIRQDQERRILLSSTGDDRNFFILDMATGQIKFMSGQPVPDEPDRDPGR